jgi:hypothetical protein
MSTTHSTFSINTQRRIVMLLTWSSLSGGVWVHELQTKYEQAFGDSLFAELNDDDSLLMALTSINDVLVMYPPQYPHLPFLRVTARCFGTSHTADPVPRWCTWVPAAAAGFIVGKEGQGIKDICARTRTYFYVDPVLHDASTLQRVVFNPPVSDVGLGRAIASLRQRVGALHQSYLTKQEMLKQEETLKYEDTQWSVPIMPRLKSKYAPLTCFQSIWNW